MENTELIKGTVGLELCTSRYYEYHDKRNPKLVLDDFKLPVKEVDRIVYDAFLGEATIITIYGSQLVYDEISGGELSALIGDIDVHYVDWRLDAC